MLTSCLRELVEEATSAFDFVCGTGSATPYLFDLIGVESVIGLDVLEKSLDMAKRTYPLERAQSFLFNQSQPSERIDLAFCNGVFHHIPLSGRASVVDYIYRLRPRGLFALGKRSLKSRHSLCDEPHSVRSRRYYATSS